MLFRAKIKILGQLRHGCSKTVEDSRYVPDAPEKFAVADMITGYGVAESVRHFYDIFKGSDLRGKRAIIQGWGNVVSAAACYLAKEGVKIVGIIDREGGILAPEGLGLEQVKHLFNDKIGNKITESNLLSFNEVNEKIWKMGADIFIPGAASKLVTRAQVDDKIGRQHV